MWLSRLRNVAHSSTVAPVNWLRACSVADPGTNSPPRTASVPSCAVGPVKGYRRNCPNRRINLTVPIFPIGTHPDDPCPDVVVARDRAHQECNLGSASWKSCVSEKAVRSRSHPVDDLTCCLDGTFTSTQPSWAGTDA